MRLLTQRICIAVSQWTGRTLNRTQRQLMENAELRINDHYQIRVGAGKFTAQQALAEHELSRAWLKQALFALCIGFDKKASTSRRASDLISSEVASSTASLACRKPS